MLDTQIWRQRPCPDDCVAELVHSLQIRPLLARLLVGRGLSDPEAAQHFLSRRLTTIPRPQELRGMERAARRFAQALDQGQRILVHGDYDVDGCTATTLISLFCRALGQQALAWIPDRRIDGYGLGEASLAAVQEHQAQLMITVDCGIADQGWAARIEQEAHCDVIITDHHLPQGPLPQCLAVVNPNQPDCPYPNKALAGVAVAWKLCWATACELTGSERLPESLRAFLLEALALVALGTVADCVPLQGENRILVHHGLKALLANPQPGLRALCAHVGCSERINAADVGWKIAPLLNASGRLGSAMRNIHLLTCQSPGEAEQWLQEVIAENTERRRLSQVLSEDLIAEVENQAQRYQAQSSIVFAGEGWHAGVVGIVAARLTQRFAKPSAVIAIEEGLGKGSLRGVPGVHLGRALDACRPLLQRGGGHAMAAGLSIAAEAIPDFCQAFEQAIQAQVPGGLEPPGIEHDGGAQIRDFDATFYADLERLAPFGQGNPEPLLLVSGARFVTQPQFFGRNAAHLRGALTDAAGGLQPFLAWQARSKFPDLATSRCIDALVRPQQDWFRDRPQQRLVLVDYHRMG